jgi:hypothetical protein
MAILEKEEQKTPPPPSATFKAQHYTADSPGLVTEDAAQDDFTAVTGNVTPVEPPNLKGVATTDKDIAAAGKPVGPIALSKRITYSRDTGTVVGPESRTKTDYDFAKTEKTRMIPQTSPNSDFASSYVARSNQPVNQFNFSGKTVDKEKYPLENITLRVKGDTIGTVSDELGRFQLNLPDSQVTLVASGVGIETREFVARSRREKLEIELEESKSQALQDAVVLGYARKNTKQAQKLDIDTADASPKGGWANFTRYIEKNKQVKAGKQPVYVVLSFEVDENGRPASVDIIDSGGKTLDKEAVRLLKEGPSWINKTKDKITFAKITIVL